MLVPGESQDPGGSSRQTRSEEPILRRTRQLAVLYELGTLVNRSLDLHDVLSAAMQRLREVLHCDVAAFFAPAGREDSSGLQFRLGSGFPVEALEEERQSSPAAGEPQDQAATAKQVVFVEDLQSKGRVMGRLLRRSGIRSAAYIPMEIHGRLMGVLALGRKEPTPFSGEDIDLFLPLSQLFATAIANVQLFADLQRHQGILARLSSKILTAQEEERRHLSRELHDGIGQSLSALKLGLGMLSSAAGELSAEMREDLNRTLEIATDTIAELRRISHDLRPPILDDLGLIPTLRWFAKRFQTQTGLQIRVKVSGEERPVSPVQDVNVYRIVQEALTNVVKHAEASRVLLQVECDHHKLRIRISDNGQGFNPNINRGEVSGLGLAGIEERVHLMGGSFKIESRAGRGTHLQMEIPTPATAPPSGAVA